MDESRMYRIVWANRGLGTAIAAAFCRALGIRPETGRARGKTPGPAEYRGVGWCFANHGSPMDGRR